ncbi:MAG: flagellar motor switch protein FliG [Spirochaetota bacterium]|nr:flagellar motor switch protein FliG [Spirochaetota bacterium]
MTKKRTTPQKTTKTESTAISKSTQLDNIPVKAPAKEKGLNGIQKVAVLLVTLGSDVAASVLQQLDEEEVQLLSKEIAQIGKISTEDKEKVLKEFKELLESRKFISKGGSGTAKEILSKAFGQDQADKIFSNISKNIIRKPFEFLNKIGIDEIIFLLKNEHPQTIALTLSYLNPDVASSVLKGLHPDLQAPIAKKIAKIERVSPSVIIDTENVLKSKLSQISNGEVKRVNGVNVIAEILNNMDRDNEKNILESIEDDSEELADEIKEKMFLFEDIAGLIDREIQKIIELASTSDLALALKGEESEIRDRFFSNMSKTRKIEIEDEMKRIGRVRYRDVHSAQQKILNLSKILESKGDIYLKNRNAKGFVV